MLNSSSTVDINHTDAVHLFAPRIPQVDPMRVLKIQGYTDLESIRPRVRTRIVKAANDAVAATIQSAAPACAWTRAPMTLTRDDHIILGNTIELDCGAFRRFLDGADSCVVFAVTLGSPFDAAVTQALEADELLAGVLMESAGWLAVEAITKQWTIALRDSAKLNDLRLTRRMSPGYQYQVKDVACEWELKQQHALFSAFGDAPVPVSLLESSAMLPKMSRSGLIGLKPAA